MIRVLLLGPVAVRADGVEALVKGPQQSLLLALLALQPGRSHSAEELIDRSWVGEAPATAHAALRVHLARVRALFGPVGPTVLPRGRQGYALNAAEVTTDLAELESLCEVLATEPEPADGLAACEAALALWRGEPFGGLLHDPELRVEAERLGELRLDLEESRAEYLLQLGRHVEAGRDLAGLVAAHPLRERRSRLLMLAQYRAGRQADALGTFRSLRDRLVEDLGVDPSEDTRRLEVRILRQDPELTLDPGARDPRIIPDIGRPDAVRPVQRTTTALRMLVGGRLQLVGSEAARLVGLVATLGDAASVEVVAAAAGLPPAGLGAALEPAARAGLVAVPVQPGAPFTLPRQELRDAILALVGEDTRVALDAAAAQALAAQGTGASLVRAAWHRLNSIALDPERARLLVIQAVDACLASGAAHTAEALCTAGLAQTESATPAGVDLLTRRVRALSALGRADEAEESWAAAIAAARVAGDPDRLALAVLAGDWALRNFHIHRGGLDDLLIEALAGLGERPSALRTRLQSSVLLEGLQVPERRAAAPALADEIEAGAAGLDDTDALAAALRARHTLLRGVPDRRAREEVGARFMAAAERSGDPWWLGVAGLGLVYDACVAGRFATVGPLLTTVAEAAERGRSERVAWHYALTQATLHRERGEFATSDRWAEQAVVRGAAAGIADALVAWQLHQVLARFLQTSAGPLADQVVMAAQLAPANGVAVGAVALTLAQAGRLDEARVQIDRGVQLVAREIPEVVPLAAGLLAQAAHAGRVPEAADALLALLTPYSGQFVAFGQVAATFGPVDRLLGLLHALRGQPGAAEAMLVRAEQASVAAGAGLWPVVTAADRVGVLLGAGRTAEAAGLASDTLDAAERLGLRSSLAQLHLALGARGR